MDTSGLSSMMTYFMGAVSVYCLYCAVKGSGKAYEWEDLNPEFKDEYQKFMRLFLFIIGGVLLISSILDLTVKSALVVWISLGFVLLAFIWYIILIKKFRKPRPPKK